MAKSKNTETEQKKDQCFIITPIGDENSEIRRHIEGIIDAVIKPALEEQYEIVVAHRISTLGSITKQIIEAIYNSKLVIANLTNCNPNVMYELALRHGIGKPAIMIAVEGTKLPSDVMMQRTIFYRNDAMGVLKLREDLFNAASKIDFTKSSGLVFEALGEISHDAAILKNVAEQDTDSKGPLEYIMKRLDQIENSIISQGTTSVQTMKNLMFIFQSDYFSEECDLKGLDANIADYLSYKGCEQTAWDIGDGKLYVGVKCPTKYPRRDLGMQLCRLIRSVDIPCLGWTVNDI